VIPWLDGGEVREIKIRRPVCKEKHPWVHGGCPVQFVAGALDHRRTVAVLEGELLIAVQVAKHCSPGALSVDQV
jgi:hypothetical protein